MADILIVAATKHERPRFERATYLGFAVQRLARNKRIETAITYQNRQGLPAVFNAQITETQRNKIAIFTHDDVSIDDSDPAARLDLALRSFQLVGVAGNRRRAPRQPSWAFVTDTPSFEVDHPEYLSGSVSHLTELGSSLRYYGPSPAECKLLDGVFLAARIGALLDRNLRFDERFPFHFYDVDFCRAAEAAGLRLGTWPISVAHASEGDYDSAEWRRCRDLYFEKWKE